MQMRAAADGDGDSDGLDGCTCFMSNLPLFMNLRMRRANRYILNLNFKICVTTQFENEAEIIQDSIFKIRK